jgi:hypothetical protein
MNTEKPTMKVDPTDQIVNVGVGEENTFCFGLLDHDFAAFEISGFEEGVELKTYTWMQQQTNGPLNPSQTVRAIEGWRMRMRREFMDWGGEGKPDCWEYIPVALREWCDTQNDSPKWREHPVLFLWRCHLWQARLRGCREISRDSHKDEDESSWEREFGWIYGPMDNRIVWSPRKRVPFRSIPESVAEFLRRDWLARMPDPLMPPVWDSAYEKRHKVDTRYSFKPWTGIENWIPEGVPAKLERRLRWFGECRTNPRFWISCPASVQNDPEVVDATRSGWVRALQEDPSIWEECPALFQGAPVVIDAYQRGWISLILRSPESWRDCPASVRAAHEAFQALKAAWLNRLQKDFLTWGAKFPTELEGDEEAVEMVKQKWLTFLRSNPRKWAMCPSFLLRRTETLETLKTVWLSLIEEDPACWNECPDILATDPQVLKTRNTRRARLLLDSPPRRIEDIPAELLAEFLSLKYPLPHFADACFETLADHPHANSGILQLWRNSPDPARAYSTEALTSLRRSPWNLVKLSVAQQDHPLIRETAVKGWAEMLPIHPCLAGLLPENLRTHPLIRAALAALLKASSPEASSAAKKAEHRILQMVRAQPGITDEALQKLALPANRKKEWKQVTALRRSHWKKLLRKNWEAWQRMPVSLRDEESLLVLMRQTLGPQIRENPAIWECLDACYRNDPCLERVYRIATRAG